MLWVDRDLCTGCGTCLKACPIEGAIALVEGKALINSELCNLCRACVNACSEGAINGVREDEVLEKVRSRSWVTHGASAGAAIGSVAIGFGKSLFKRWLRGRGDGDGRGFQGDGG